MMLTGCGWPRRRAKFSASHGAGSCGDLWFLAQLFASPDHQGRSIGNELLKRTFEYAKNSGATNRALITFTFNTVSQGLYIRNGLFPRCPIYNFSVAA